MLFGGRGGVGRTTAAAATAAVAADRGARVLLVSTDPALADVLDTPLGPAPTPVADFFATQVGPGREWPVVRAGLAALLAGVDADPGAVAAGLTLPTGFGELAALLAVRDEVGRGDWDAVLLDCPPTGRMLSLLALPEALAGQLERLWPAHRRLVGAVRPAVADAVGAVQDALAGVRAVLATASVRLVLTPDRVVAADARRTLTALALHGVPVDSVLVNRVLPAGDAAWVGARRAAQQDVLTGLRLDLPLRHAPDLPVGPVGPAALLALGAELYGTGDPLAPAPAAEPPAVSRSGAGYELRVALPYVRRSEVRLARSGDELVLTVGDQLRRLALPSVLRRCVAVGASAGDGALRVRFDPDPAQWPEGLTP